MWGLGRGQGRSIRRLVLLVLAAAVATRYADGAGAAPVEHVRVGDGETAIALRSALGRAVRRLDRPACRGVLSEFQDDSGRTLQAVLDQAGETPAVHIAGLYFYDGSATPQCQAPSTMAFTSRGSRVVLVCSSRLRAQQRRDASQVDVVVIHETLHTLGLGENPPTSQFISARVFSRCVANGGR